MELKERKTTNVRQCPYCNSNNVNYLCYSQILDDLATKCEKPEEKRHDFKCEDCKRIFYYQGAL